MALGIFGPPEAFGALSQIPPKTQNTTGIWPFFTQFRPICEHIQANIEPMEIHKALKIRDFTEFPGFAAIFSTFAQIGALLGS